ncbi:MAG: DEAD/DEAH box helicase family protein [Nitrososphaeraceae archaeon]|nr:DEAD/DEAH box helicase family protein [Nitrososphaeraceae archaeon]
MFDYDDKNRKGKLICEEDILTYIRNHFSVKNKGADFANRSYKAKLSNRKLPSRIYAIQESGNFNFGIHGEILNFLRDEQIIDISSTESFDKRLKCGFTSEIVSDTLTYELRDYQAECIQTCVQSGYGTVVSATGSGKSLMQAYLLENWKLINGSLNALIIVPGVGLVNQLCSDFEEYGVTFSYSPWTGKHEKQDTEVIIVNTELLCSRFYDHKDLLTVDILLRDECHGNKAQNEMTKIIQKVKTPNKFGFTGTLPKENIDRWKILGAFGPIIFEKSSKELIDEKFLTNVEVKVLKLNHTRPMRFPYKREVAYLEQSEARNNFISTIAKKLSKNVLILVNHIEHAEMLFDTFRGALKQVFYITGEMPVEERERIIELMENNDDIVCIAISKIFSTGINVKNLHYVMFTFGGKSFVRTIQSIGRGLRLHESKDKLIIFDFYDNSRYSTEHFEERKIFYDDEQIPWKQTEIVL